MTGKPGSFSGRLFGQTSDSRIGFWLRRVLALIAGNLVVHFLPVMAHAVRAVATITNAIRNHAIDEREGAVQQHQRDRGLLSVVFGLIVLFAPGAGALGLIWAIASYSIVFGILFIALALRLRKYGHAAGPAAAA